MALDRRITIHIEALGHTATQMDVDDGAVDRNGDPVTVGYYVPGPTTDYPVWTERRAVGSSDSATPTGIVTSSVVTYLVRWFQTLELSNIALVTITDEFNQLWDVETVSPSDARRRAITLTCFRSNG